MQIRIERIAAPGKLLILGLTETGEVAFDVQLRRWEQTDRWVGVEMGPVIEIDWLEVKQPFRSLKITFLALCEALTAAVSLAGDTVPTVGLVTDNERLEDTLIRRDDFHRVTTLPMPFLATRASIEKLRDRVCR